jgi:hypothetical protein
MTVILLDVVYERYYLKFRRIVMLPASGIECKPNNKPGRSMQEGEFFVASFLVISLLFNPEDQNNVFFFNISIFLPDYTTSHSRS